MFDSIGSDVEVFAKHKDGHHVALCGMIGGTKEAPLQIKEFSQGFMIQEDNVSLEFNIPPCTSKTMFQKNIKQMRGFIKSHIEGLGFILSEEASCSFDVKELTHPNALMFGCEPDYDAWTLRENNKPSAVDKTLRTCGGHIHVGSSIDMVKGVRNMDLFLGIPSVLLDTNPSSIIRRELYGKAGAMRPKPYGWEYRTLSNFWIFKDYLIDWVYDSTHSACIYGRELSKSEGIRIAKCINKSDKKEAETIMQDYGFYLPKESQTKVDKFADFGGPTIAVKNTPNRF